MITWKPTQWHSILTRLARSRRLTEAERGACADALDRNSELASQVEESHDVIDSLVDASGAPDGESLLKRVGELRGMAAERDRLTLALDSARERAAAEFDHANRWASRCHLAEAENEEYSKIRGERDALKARVAAIESTAPSPEYVHISALQTAIDARNALLIEKEQIEHRLRDLESSPIHPAIARVVEAAKGWGERFGIVKHHNQRVQELLEAIRATPSPLPRVVTCGECVNSWATSERHIHCGQWGRVFLASDYCSSGKRREP